MSNKNRDPFQNVELDSQEQQLSDAIERGEFKEVENMEEEKARITKIFQEAGKKNRRISIRVNSLDLESIRARAAQNQLPYQTLISTILHNFAKGKIKLEL